MTWLLALLLTGFVLRFIASEVMQIKSGLDWRWELAATVLWPITLVFGMIVRLRRRPMELIVMRLADMKRVHPDQIIATCAGCGHIVAVYPSGQAIMKQHPGVKLMCQVCRQPAQGTELAPGAASEPFQSVRKQ